MLLLNNFTLLRIFYFLAGTFIITIALTPLLTDILYRKKVWKVAKKQAISGEKAVIFNSLHGEKLQRHIPTMAGILIWGVVAIITYFFNLSRAGTFLPLFTLVAFGLLGLIDDFINIKGSSDVAGLKFTTKLISTLLLSAVGALWFYYKLDWTIIHIPWAGLFNLPYNLDIGLWYIPLFIFVIVSSANAVNITDGLDGLAGGLLAIAFGVYIMISLSQGKVELAIFNATIVGAILAYTWFNIYPARFFMGDTGSLALGATLGVVAMLTNTAVILPIIAIVFVVDTLSVILQLFWKKFFKRKLLPISPLHHTFEYLGWPETKVTMRLWVIGAVIGVIGLILALMGS
jgi:phospho-N-acetylmuramoyl-pentapeptide-transferase